MSALLHVAAFLSGRIAGIGRRLLGRPQRHDSGTSEPGPPEDLIRPTGPPRFRQRDLVSDAERRFHARLVKALPEYTVFTQVAMSALVEPVDQPGSPGHAFARARFARKYVDYVLCVPASLDVVAVIELDDPSHDGRAIEDADREAILASAGYRVLRWDVRDLPSDQEIAAALSIALTAGSLATGRK